MAVSDRVKSGPEKAPHRSLWKALGLTDEELKLPLIGVVSAKSECVPGHNHLNNIAQAVKDGIRLAGGVPVEFPAIGVCDGIAMGHVGMKYSLASRELIADSCESMAIAHGFDGMVFIPNCDKIVPGMLMAAARLDLPCIFVPGGSMFSGPGYADQETPYELAQEIYAACGAPFWLLLAHRNDRFAREYSLLGADLTISGHGHGGIWRFPFTDGVFGTQRNLFPTHTAGFYSDNGASVFVSRGLGNSPKIVPRILNRPQVAVITLERG